MKYLRTYESTNTPTYDDLLYKFVTTFKNEADFYSWATSQQDIEDFYTDWDNIIGYDLPIEFGLPTYNKEITEMLSDVTTVDLDDPTYDDLRSGKISIDEWKESIKYNL